MKEEQKYVIKSGNKYRMWNFEYTENIDKALVYIYLGHIVLRKDEKVVRVRQMIFTEEIEKEA